MTQRRDPFAALSANQLVDIKKWYSSVRSATIARVQKMVDAKTAEDIAGWAMDYALNFLVTRPQGWPTTDTDWTRLSIYKARLMAQDEVNRLKRISVPMLLLDKPLANEEGESSVEAPLVAARSHEVWLETRARRKDDLRRVALRGILPDVVKTMKVKDEKKVCGIFTDFFFNHESMRVVAARYGIKENNGNQVVNRVKQAYRQEGRRLIGKFLRTYEEAA